MKSNPDYPLPTGELGEDEIVCQLVYLPNRPEYWQALLTELHFLTTWQAWERDEDKRGKDAASNFRDAFELTMGCWRMTCLEDLQANVAAILALMQTGVCCDGENITYGDSTVYITTINPGVGDDPTYYGETAVADWEEWLEYLCYSANAWVDNLVAQANQAETALGVGGMTVALLAYMIASIAYYIVGGTFNASVTMLGVINMVAGYTTDLFGDAADNIEAARDEIVCAVMLGGDVSVAVEDALSSGTAWDLFYSLIDYESAVAILYEGGDGETYLEAEKLDTCNCDSLGEYRYEWGWPIDDMDEFTDLVGYDWRETQQEIHIHYTNGYRQIYVAGGQLRTWATLSSAGNIRVRRIGFTAAHYHGYTKCRINIVHSGGTYSKTFDLTTDMEPYILNLDAEEENLTVRENDQIQIGGWWTGSGDHFYLDDVFIEFDDLD
jgi:hypothetical protein